MATSHTKQTANADNAVDRAAHGAHEMIDRVAEKARPAVERLRDEVDSAGQTIRTGVDQLGRVPGQWLETSRACVRDYPLASVGIAVAAGMLLRRLLVR